jgi:DNA (cytosine-5)-methyltransferase 1
MKKEFKLVVSDVQAYKQFGNSVSVPVVKTLAKEILKQFNPNSVAFMNLEQKTALYKKKALKDIDPKNRLYDVLNDKIDETIKKYYA